MVTAVATGEDGRRVIVLGVTRDNLVRLMNGRPIHVEAESHPGFPADLAITIFYGASQRALVEQLQPLLNENTKVIGVPRTPPTKTS